MAGQLFFGHPATGDDLKEVDAVSRQIAGQTQDISASTEQQSASMEEIASSSKALANLAAELQDAVRQFKTLRTYRISVERLASIALVAFLYLPSFASTAGNRGWRSE